MLLSVQLGAQLWCQRWRVEGKSMMVVWCVQCCAAQRVGVEAPGGAVTCGRYHQQYIWCTDVTIPGVGGKICRVV
jgi:hypothetical protein